MVSAESWKVRKCQSKSGKVREYYQSYVGEKSGKFFEAMLPTVKAIKAK